MRLVNCVNLSIFCHDKRGEQNKKLIWNKLRKKIRQKFIRIAGEYKIILVKYKRKYFKQFLFFSKRHWLSFLIVFQIYKLLTYLVLASLCALQTVWEGSKKRFENHLNKLWTILCSKNLFWTVPMSASAWRNFPMICRRLYMICRRLLVGLIETNT